jgi:hypothetical protein
MWPLLNSYLLRFKLTKRSKRLLMVLIPVVVILLVASNLFLSALLSSQMDRYALLTAQNFADTNYAGRACGILSPQKVKALFGQQLNQSGTILPGSSPTAKVRFNAPRLDSCSYTGANTNADYADLIIKTYRSTSSAQDAFKHDTVAVLDLADRAPMYGLAQLKYGAGVYYGLHGSEVIELSAGKQGLLLEPGSESFVGSILGAVVEDL